MNNKLVFKLSVVLLVFSSCAEDGFQNRLIPAEEFTKSVKDGYMEDYSIFKVTDRQEIEAQKVIASENTARAALANKGSENFAGDGKYLEKGLELKNSVKIPGAEEIDERQLIAMKQEAERKNSVLPPGSKAPYVNGQMTANPSLWPDESQGANLFSDFRAFQPMDVITVTINESSEGKKKTKTNSEGKFSIVAGIKNLFGIETKDWKSNNEALDPENLINASTQDKFEGKGETNRSGELKAQMSAVILEVLPNNLMRIEGTKIVSVDNEEEVMVISGLIRGRDVNSQNQVDSNRIANMRIDFYGRGVLAQKQSPGWGARLISAIWPF
ncbi:MAG: flagellar basal body L-ring protein FlgH [Proteobacteria bacterium]|nr:flagellar basal body L-ring protein FlgH [Pseudomonadota bacterium]